MAIVFNSLYNHVFLFVEDALYEAHVEAVHLDVEFFGLDTFFFDLDFFNLDDDFDFFRFYLNCIIISLLPDVQYNAVSLVELIRLFIAINFFHSNLLVRTCLLHRVVFERNFYAFISFLIFTGVFLLNKTFHFLSFTYTDFIIRNFYFISFVTDCLKSLIIFHCRIFRNFHILFIYFYFYNIICLFFITLDCFIRNVLLVFIQDIYMALNFRFLMNVHYYMN